MKGRGHCETDAVTLEENTMSTARKPVPIDRTLIAQGFAANAKGKMQQTQIDSIVESLLSDAASYPATGSFNPTLRLTITGGETFTASAVPFGTGQFSGDVLTDNLDALYANTVSFLLQATPVYISLQFFDGNQNLLGHFLGGAVSVAVGVGGGSGSWAS
jgi:Rhodococcus equi virulence-associated protein